MTAQPVDQTGPLAPVKRRAGDEAVEVGRVMIAGVDHGVERTRSDGSRFVAWGFTEKGASDAVAVATGWGLVGTRVVTREWALVGAEDRDEVTA